MGKGGRGKSKKSRDWYEIKLMIALPSDELLHEPDTGMSKQDIYNFFDKESGMNALASELIDDANDVRKASKKMIDPVLEIGIKNKRIKFRPPFKNEKTRGSYYKTIIGEDWIKLKREHRRSLKELGKKRR